MKTRDDIRNIAIIAHVDHGKTTLVNELLKQSDTLDEHVQIEDRAMDTNDIEKERGITILSKNTAVRYDGKQINILDTPGHADSVVKWNESCEWLMVFCLLLMLMKELCHKLVLCLKKPLINI
ncbi:GTP-binding protein TypA/BipA [Lentilactobacillus kosonis]|uniref:GTP-binding protein TypA/BipA n=1 Tax=Lentilactobacillus kosonis TaxID=2810561 RepID=A0A401FP02_9LACO|nr:GTP-binding protein TypA/BipA [Lentilactobacillus kosonis]